MNAVYLFLFYPSEWLFYFYTLVCYHRVKRSENCRNILAKTQRDFFSQQDQTREQVTIKGKQRFTSLLTFSFNSKVMIFISQTAFSSVFFSLWFFSYSWFWVFRENPRYKTEDLVEHERSLNPNQRRNLWAKGSVFFLHFFASKIFPFILILLLITSLSDV